ncbi:mechanosensitive ion channel family protein [Fusobacterium sp.]|uniref:mechanosensitive ion channel family protein n=1 Tax=Fusobacterium sp. TaxID=68766 RepID=UPI0028FFDBBA|nr:mechanosensitive ion channel domain-containing protein [Fusobacterium sp.]MDU1910614.1 mechanosensitive ion channel [Fusobacterium sp.]
MWGKLQIFAEEWIDMTIRGLPDTMLKIVLIVFLLVIVNPVVRISTQTLKVLMEKSHVDELLVAFIVSLAKTIMYVIFFFLLIGSLGVKATSLLTLLGTAGLAVGLALQGSLSNLAGGVLILFFKPFLKGEWIESNAGSGVVETIHILYTVLNTKDNAKIIVPNGQLANSALKNISRNTERRVDLEVSVAYGTSGEKVKEILKEIADNHSKILHEKGYTIRMCRHNSSSLDYNYRVWVLKENYWEVYYDLLEEVIARFDKDGIEVPYQKIDIYNK